MRRIGAFKKEGVAQAFVQRLNEEHITALIEDDGGEYSVWVHDEGHIKLAKKLFAEAEDGSLSLKEVPKQRPTDRPPLNEFSKKREKESKTGQISYNAVVTKLLLFLCAFVYVYSLIQMQTEKTESLSVISIPPFARHLLIDFPETDVIRTELIDTYGLQKVKDGNLPPEAAPLLQRFRNTIPWVGLYNIMLQPDEKREVLWQGEFLRDVREGQVWRLFTPAILHLALLHFLFNILWLSVLGRMMEFNIGRVRFALFVLLTAIFSNVCQYIMTGPYFMGISGVLSACIGYILVRKRIAPWEVYLLGKEVLYFFLVFIFGFLALQVVAFFLQYFNLYTIPLSIANTGHISGLFLGMFLARTGLLSKKP